MKIYIEKWTTETVHTGKLFSIDTETLRERYEDLAVLSDEELIERVCDEHYDYDCIIECDDALSTCDISGEGGLVKLHTSETLQEDLKWGVWHRGRLTLNEEYIDIDTENFEEFVSKIPHYK
jgi:hypothetical protein